MRNFYRLQLAKPGIGHLKWILALTAAALVLSARPASPSPLDAPVVQQGAAAEVPAELPTLKKVDAAAQPDPLAWDAPAPVAAAPADPEPVAVAAPAAPEPAPAAPAVADVPAPPVKPAGEGLAAIEKRLGVLERKLSALEDAVSVLRVDTDSAAPARKGSSGAAVPARPLASKIKKVHRKKAATPQWVLKGAKPGMAWLAEKGSAELRAVTIGDTLPGLGKITAVTKDSAGAWMVSGTGGRISQ